MSRSTTPKFAKTMLQYLIILLDDTSTSYCHYESKKSERKLISLNDLKAGIFFAMKENLMLQFVYPDYELPREYKDIINTIDHSDIVSNLCKDIALKYYADVIVIHDFAAIDKKLFEEGKTYVLRTSKDNLFDKYTFLKPILGKVKRLNIVITDVDDFCEEDFDKYKRVLSLLSEEIENLYVKGKSAQLQISVAYFCSIGLYFLV